MSDIKGIYRFAPATYPTIEPNYYSKDQVNDIIKRTEFKLLVELYLRMEDLNNGTHKQERITEK